MRYRISQKGVYPEFKIQRKCWYGWADIGYTFPHYDGMGWELLKFVTLEDAEKKVASLIEDDAYNKSKWHVVKVIDAR